MRCLWEGAGGGGGGEGGREVVIGVVREYEYLGIAWLYV